MSYQVILFTDMIESVYHVKALGAYNLATVLRKNGYSVLVIDHLSKYAANPKLLHEVIQKAIGNETLVVGFSGSFFSNKKINEINFDTWEKFRVAANDFYCGAEREVSILQKIIKSRYPHIKFVYGGQPAQQEHELVKRNVELDYVIKGYAESSFLNLVNQLSRGARILGKTIGKTTIIESSTNSFEFKQHATTFDDCDVVLPGETLAIETSRGCMYNCTFCSFPVRNRKRGDLDYHTDDELLYQHFMDNYNRYGVLNYTIVDDTFNETTDKLRRFRDIVKRTKLPLQFMCWLRLDLVGNDMDQIDILLDAGIRSAWFGLESLNDDTLRSARKNYTSEFAKQTLQKIRQVAGPDFRIYSSFIIGLPHDTVTTINDWMTWVIEQSPIDCIEVIPLFITTEDNTLWPSEFSLHSDKYGYVTQGDDWSSDNMNKTQAKQLAIDYNKLIWDTGRNRLACFDLFGIMNHGYTFDELKDTPINQLPFNEIIQRGNDRFNQYHNGLIKQISGGCK